MLSISPYFFFGSSTSRVRALCGATLTIALAAALLTGCGGRDTPVSLGAVENVASPAASGSGEPGLSSYDGRIYMSWVESAGDKQHALRFAVREDAGWSAPRTIAQGKDWFVNWADFPSLVVSGGDHMVAHWLQKNGEDTYAYGVRVSQSLDGGKSWNPPVIPHAAGVEAEHGFVSMLPWRDDRIFIAWLDGRNFVEGEHGSATQEMTLQSALLDRNGRMSAETGLDDRVCDCCQTAAVRTDEGAIVAYRDRSPGEVRDISIVRFDGARWTRPATVHDDRWEIHGCPVNGPALAAMERRVAVAWFTNANELSRVNISFSDDGGAIFGAPIRVDDGDPIGRVDVIMLADASTLVCWMESTDDGADIRFRRIDPAGIAETSRVLTPSSEERASGFPRMARAGDEVYFAWTLIGDPSQVRTAVLHTSGGPRRRR